MDEMDEMLKAQKKRQSIWLFVIFALSVDAVLTDAYSGIGISPVIILLWLALGIGWERL